MGIAAQIQSGGTWSILDHLPDPEPEFDAAWRRLAGRVGSPTPFQDLCWLRTWWGHFGAGREAAIITLTRDKEMVAAAALSISTRSLLPGRPLRILEFLGSSPVPTRGLGLVDRTDVLVPEDSPELLDDLVHQIFALPRFDLLWLRGLPAASSTARAIEREAARMGVSYRIIPRSKTPVTNTAQSWEAFLGTREGKIRRKLRNSERRLAGAGAPEQTSYPENGWTADEAVETLLAVNRRSYKWTQGTSLFQAPALRSFFEDYLRALAAEDRLRVQFLLLDDEPIAYQIGLIHERRRFSYNAAYAADFAEVHPGIHLLTEVLRQACNGEEVAEYDMGRGDEAYKLHWCTDVVTEVDVIVRRRGAIRALGGAIHFSLRAFLSRNATLRRLYRAMSRSQSPSPDRS